ncbi:hypothetical protein ILUMI_23961 [Ignelater luminosus]|uniref:Retroviral polymerase SH3-like domain-containing protein n=1 Tax=Ignelater luminosus TaxID=2038154 RepID=A0A8K0C7Y4_IGNLU|nr:hypothetical protein ILUMI_23961 [Ignelater luminosus]
MVVNNIPGISERFNRTILNMARCIIFDSGMSKSFRDEAIRTAAYILNRLPTSAVESNSTAAELWFQQKVNTDNIRVFDSKAYTHVPKELRGKLDERSKPMLMIGYTLNGIQTEELWKQRTNQEVYALYRERRITTYVEVQRPKGPEHTERMAGERLSTRRKPIGRRRKRKPRTRPTRPVMHNKYRCDQANVNVTTQLNYFWSFGNSHCPFQTASLSSHLSPTRPDLSFAVTYFSQFQNCFNMIQRKYFKDIVRYLKYTENYGIKCVKSGNLDVNVSADFDFAHDVNDRKSINGYILKSNNKIVFWKTKKYKQ